MRRLRGCWFRLSEETFDAAHYGGMAAFKLGIFVFSLAPFVALSILRLG